MNISINIANSFDLNPMRDGGRYCYADEYICKYLRQELPAEEQQAMDILVPFFGKDYEDVIDEWEVRENEILHDMPRWQYETLRLAYAVLSR